MASPSNASEPESPDDDEIVDEEEILEPGFDVLLFWDQYWQAILVAAGVLVLAGAGFGIYEFRQSQRIQAAGAALAQASTEDEYRQVMETYDGTAAAGDAALFLAGALRDDKKYDDALQVLQDFLDKYPKHPLVAAGDLSIGETLESQGKLDEANAKYEEVAAKYPDSFAAPVAVLEEATILKSQGKIDDARRLYENFVAQFPNSDFSQESMAELHLLHPPAGAAPAQATNAEGLSSLLKPAAAPAASVAPTPAASAAPSAPAPLLPVIPGASPQ